MIDLSDQVILITGGGSGIGYGMAEEMIKLGGKIVITGRSEEKLKKAKKSLGENCFVFINDVRDKEGHPAFVSQIEEEIGPITCLINNAGIHLKKFFLDVTDDDFQAIIDTNLSSIYSLTREVLRNMVLRRYGSVIFISSMVAFYGVPQVTAYSVTKSALLGLMRGLATEYSGEGIRFNCIAPGFIESEMFLRAMDEDPERKRRVLERTPLGRLGLPADIGKAAAFLASDAASFINGVCLPVDGGNSIGF